MRYCNLGDIGLAKSSTPLDFTKFETLPFEKQEMYLALAQRHIDNSYMFKGYRLKANQSNSFPRIDLPPHLDNGVIPRDMKIAVCIYAYCLYNFDVGTMINVTNDIKGSIKTEKIGRTLTKEYHTQGDSVQAIDLNKYNLLQEFLKPYLSDLYLCRG